MQRSWTDAPAIALVGARALDHAAELAESLHLPGLRDAHRAFLIVAKDAFEAALRGVCIDARETLPAWVVACKGQLLRVYRAFTEDARYGVGQLSRAAQRAPTAADCDDGWQRVEEIARGAESVADKARALVSDYDSARLRKLVGAIVRSAAAARATIEARNRAYTFHANPTFSFGEGWYAAAAAVLEGIELQIEPAKKHTAAAVHFLANSGLGERLRVYRPRPRANKALPLIVADAFQRDPLAAQTRLRAAFLTDAEVVPRVRQWLGAALPVVPERPTVLIWNRQGAHDAHRNSAPEELHALCEWAQQAALWPILIGDGLGEMLLPLGTLSLALFWKEPLFQGLDMRRAQLALFEALRDSWRLVGQCGVTTAGMDGPALLGLPTLYLTDEPNVRLGRWVGAVPGYEEVVRDGTHEARIRARFAQWARRE